MALIDKLFPDDPDDDNLPIHNFLASLHLWTRGKVTRANVISAWSLETADETQLDMLKTKFDSLTGANKWMWYEDLKAVLYLLEAQKITKAQAKTLLGL